MIIKKADNKLHEIQTLKTLLQKSNSKAQKKLIQSDLSKLKNGYEAEKDNAYSIDFYLNLINS